MDINDILLLNKKLIRFKRIDRINNKVKYLIKYNKKDYIINLNRVITDGILFNKAYKFVVLISYTPTEEQILNLFVSFLINLIKEILIENELTDRFELKFHDLYYIKNNIKKLYLIIDNRQDSLYGLKQCNISINIKSISIITDGNINNIFFNLYLNNFTSIINIPYNPSDMLNKTKNEINNLIKELKDNISIPTDKLNSINNSLTKLNDLFNELTVEKFSKIK